MEVHTAGSFYYVDSFITGDLKHTQNKSLLYLPHVSDLFIYFCHSFFKLHIASQRCDRSGDGRLDHVEIEEFCRELLRRPELDAVFRHYSSNGSVLAMAELRDFLGDQGEDASLNHAQSLTLAYELNGWGRSL